LESIADNAQRHERADAVWQSIARKGEAIDLTLAGLRLKGDRLPSPSRNDDGLQYRAAAYQNLRVTSTVALVKLAIRVGLITAE
jgi:hypothetical protein